MTENNAFTQERNHQPVPAIISYDILFFQSKSSWKVNYLVNVVNGASPDPSEADLPAVYV